MRAPTARSAVRLLDVLRGNDSPVTRAQLDVAWLTDTAQRDRALDSLLVDGLVELTADRLALRSAGEGATGALPRGRDRFGGLRELATHRCGDMDIAYQVFGDGPVGRRRHARAVHPDRLDRCRNLAMYRFHRRLSSFCRLIRFDHRGMRLSSRTSAGRDRLRHAGPRTSSR